MPKHKKNAFYFFMEDWKLMKEKQGRRFLKGMRDVQADPELNIAWKNLTAEQKLYYHEKEKNSKETMDKKNSRGESLKVIEDAEKRRQQFENNMKVYLSNLLEKAKQNDDIKNLKFVVVHVNYFYKRPLDNNLFEYTPAEIALAEFSLEKGVIRTYDQLINPQIQLGYASEAKSHSAAVHQIPVDVGFNKKTHEDIYNEIIDFLNPSRINGKLPPLYTVNEMKAPVVSVIETLSGYNDDLLIYSFEELFTQLYNVKTEQKVCYQYFRGELLKDRFDYKNSTACEFHADKGAVINNCSKSIVQRWIFTLIYCTYEAYKITLISGMHIPIEYEINRQKSVVEGLSKLNISQNSMSPGVSTGAIKKEVNCELDSENQSSSDSFKKVDRKKKFTSKNQLPLSNHKASQSVNIAKRVEKSPDRESCENSFTIIDYSEKSQKPKDEEDYKPSLRLPFTQPSYSGDFNSTNLDEQNFPSLGKRSVRKNK